MSNAAKKTAPKPAIQQERVTDIAQELIPLFDAHYEEASTDKDGLVADADWNQYFALERAGMLHCLTVRDGDKLIGYFINIFQFNLHHAGVPTSISDLIYISPEYRKGTRLGEELLARGEEEMKAAGVKKMLLITKHEIMAGLLAQRKGFRSIEIVHSKWLGD